MKANETINFRMSNITVEQFAILAESEIQDESSIQYSLNITFRAEQSRHLVACKIDTLWKNNEETFIKLDLYCVFTIDEGDWSSFESDSKLTIPSEFLQYMAMHTIGTSRGVLHAKTEGTPFNKYIIPPIDLQVMLNDDLIIEL